MPLSLISGFLFFHEFILFFAMLAAILIFFIRFYQLTISPLLGLNCRFYPTCSSYMIDALKSYGVIKGGWLGIKRLCKCHPWHSGGHDPLP